MTLTQRRVEQIRIAAEERIEMVLAKVIMGYVGDRVNYGNLFGQEQRQPFEDIETERGYPGGIIESEPGDQEGGTWGEAEYTGEEGAW